MNSVKGIFGFKETKVNTLETPSRQSIEQTENYSFKQVIHTQEIYVDKLVIDKVSDTYFKYNHTSLLLELFVNGVKVAEW